MIFPSDCVDGSIEDNILWYMKVAAWSELEVGGRR